MRTLFFPAFADNHDLISMKLYELTVDKTKEEVEQEEEDEVTVPRVDNMQQFIGNAHSQIENTDISFAQTHICIMSLHMLHICLFRKGKLIAVQQSRVTHLRVSLISLFELCDSY